ncbi:uncharacterized protein LOC126263273 [Schistocerca nitens]|uniref:uncharacterized protein LOC126263273 n=1 Tax=Schistocerca nitens TaxID=7011 RepID=UPI002117697C|nr:uncharacterized protein LOC126263273 [Schistocerca nitens]
MRVPQLLDMLSQSVKVKCQSPQQQQNRRRKQQKTSLVTSASAGSNLSGPAHVVTSDSSTQDPVVQLLSMLEQDSGVLMSVPETAFEAEAASQYWTPSYAPSIYFSALLPVPEIGNLS